MTGRTAYLLLVIVGFSIAGCGGSSSTDSSGTIETSSLTKVQYVKRANAICAEGSEIFSNKLTNYMNKHEGSSKNEGELVAEALQAAVLPEVEAQTDEIEALGAPAGDKRQIEAFLAAQRRSIDSLQQRRTIDLNTELDPAFREPGKLARRYGIDICAYG